MKQPAIDVKNITVTYHDKVILWCVNAQIYAGTLMAIMGPNGAGKSTFIKTIIGLIKPLSGSISIFGGSFRKHALQVAYIPQRTEIDWDFPITVIEVVLMGRYGHIGWFRRPNKTDYDSAYLALDQVDMLAYADHHISHLSGGQQQRIFLARALAQQAEIYLLDEPFVGIDIKTEKAVITLLKKLRNQGKTVLIVHHDAQTITDYFDTILLLNVKRIAYGPVNTVFNQKNIHKTYAHYVSL